MIKSVLSIALAGAFVLGAASEAASLSAELIMPGGRSWKGQLIGRDGDWVEFSTGAKPIRVGASTIEELIFTINVDQEVLNEMNRNREYERVIVALETALEPYSEYADIPSNLTQYKALLMELHYKTKDYEKTLALARQIAADSRDKALQEKSQVYQILSLIDSGRSEEAEDLLVELGWNDNLGNDSAPEKLYVTAKLLMLQKKYADAMELVAKVIAFNSQDPEWMQPAELLCAEIYTELGMYDSADEVIREISLLYKNTNEDDLAQQLKIRVEKLRAEQELDAALESEEI
jgi:tetratricopeptide (TPR) repeat protein